MSPTVILFDIDGTMVCTDGAGRRAMDAAFSERFGSNTMVDFAFDGLTDQLIIHRALRRVDETMNESARGELVWPLINAYLAHLEREVNATDKYRLFPGVESLVHVAGRQERVALGLGTGNVKQGAAIKLARSGLYPCFQFGGFGDDHLDRATLLHIGARRGAAQLGLSVAACRVVVIGDTPLDVDAGHQIGAEVVGVGTGRYGADELLRRGAEFAFSDLTCLAASKAIFGPETNISF